MSVTANIIIYSLIAGFSTLIGVALISLNEKRALKYSHFLNSFAAGVILAVAFTHLIPESIKMTSDAMLFVCLGFAAFYLLEVILVVHSGVEMHFHSGNEDGPERAHSRALVAFIGLSFHSLLDGIIIAIGFKIDARLGALAALSVILHELPEGTTTFSLLIGSFSRKVSLWMSVVVALATPLGAVLWAFVLPDMSEPVMGRLLAVAAGSFIYIGASDLVPETHGKHGIQNALCLIAGALLIYWVGMLAHH